MTVVLLGSGCPNSRPPRWREATGHAVNANIITTRACGFTGVTRVDDQVNFNGEPGRP